MTQFTLFLPLPPPALGANSRVHWSVRHRKTRGARRRAYLAAVRALDGQPAPMWPVATLHAKFSMPHLRHDPSNLMRALKAYEDGLADAGIVENDRGLWPARPEIERDPAIRDHPDPRFRRGIVRMVVVPETCAASLCHKCGAERTYYDGWHCPTAGCDVFSNVVPTNGGPGFSAHEIECCKHAAYACDHGVPCYLPKQDMEMLHRLGIIEFFPPADPNAEYGYMMTSYGDQLAGRIMDGDVLANVDVLAHAGEKTPTKEENE